MRLLDRISDREPPTGHGGRSGALIGRGLLDAATRVAVEHATVGTGAGHAPTGNGYREGDLLALADPDLWVARGLAALRAGLVPRG